MKKRMNEDIAIERIVTMTINVPALADRGVQVDSNSDENGNLRNVFLTFESSMVINTNPLYEQFVEGGLTPAQANEILDSMYRAVNIRLMYNTIEKTQHFE